MTEIFYSDSEEKTEEIAFFLAAQGKIGFGDVLALSGDLGAGKTAFTRGLVRFFSPVPRVNSPTYALVNEYRTDGGKIWHFDMYRIDTEDDLLSVGFYDYLGGGDLIIVEWFDKIAAFFDESTVRVDIAKSGADNREIVFERTC